MSQEKTTLEVIAPTVEEAIQKGLAQLNLSQDDVDVEVLDAGSRGLFGIGSRQARIRLTIKPEPGAATISTPRAAQPANLPDVEEEDEVMETDDLVGEPGAATPSSSIPRAELDVDAQVELDVAAKIVTDLLDKMKVKATVAASYRAPEEDENEPVMMINVEGNDLSILIGRRSETLNALQYIASLIICKQLDRWVPITIDVQGYRARRERQLRQLARRMAEQAVHTGRRQVLEPMPASERRLVHMELRNNEAVGTESVGDEPNRKVTIFLKK